MTDKELYERELARRQRYFERQKEMFKRLMEKENIEVINDIGHRKLLQYKDVQFDLLQHEDWNSWNPHYRLCVGEKTLATRCNFETAIHKAKLYIDKGVC